MSTQPRVLLVSHFFPPHSAIGALRVGKLAKHLADSGWDVRALAAALPNPRSMPLELPAENVTYTAWSDVDTMLERFLGERLAWLLRQRKANNDAGLGAHSNASDESSEKPSRLRAWLRKAYLEVVRWPDNRVGWYRPGLDAGRELIRKWRPDVIYSSAPPVTSILIARALGAEHNIPWIAEFRDLWTDHPYYEYGRLRRLIECNWERRVLSTAAAVVTVSPPWQRRLLALHGRPTVLAMNGYLSADFPVIPPLEPSREGPLRILYTGHIYAGRRDPSPLFEAIASLGGDGNEIVVDFVGTQVETIARLAEWHRVGSQVNVRPAVSYVEALRQQCEADVLLHLQWCDPAEDGTIAGKLFEYLGARRPILGVALETSAAAELVHNRQAGLVTSDPIKIASQLRVWLEQKRKTGVAPTPKEAALGLDRSQQFDVVERALGAVARGHRKRVSNGPLPRDPVGFSVAPRHRAVSRNAIQRPTLLTLIDVEEEFDWSKPFSRANTSIAALERLPRAHEVFVQYGVRPTYLLDFPVANSRSAANTFQNWREKGECLIGAQLHPWVCPPFAEVVSEANTYPGNLPRDLEEAKLRMLTETIERNCGARPQIYRAGRYGLGPNSREIVERLGYEIDVSVVPFTDFRRQYGPDYSDYGMEPFWFGDQHQLLEIPVTRGFTGPLRRVGSPLYKAFGNRIGRALRVAGVAARLGLLERVTLTPEGISLQEMVRLTEQAISDGRRVFALSFHSPSLLPGCTPYVRTEEAAANFVETIRQYLKFFFGLVNGRSVTPFELRDELLVR